LEDFEKCKNEDSHCPVHTLDYIIKKANVSKSTKDILKYGAVIAVSIDWNCGIGTSGVYSCLQTYTFKDIPNPNFDKITYKYFVDVHSDHSRTLYKVFGVRLKVIVTGVAQKWSWMLYFEQYTKYCWVFSIAIYLFEKLFRRMYYQDELVDLKRVKENRGTSDRNSEAPSGDAESTVVTGKHSDVMNPAYVTNVPIQ